MAYVEGVFSGRRSKRGAIISLCLLAAASFAVGFLRNGGLDLSRGSVAEAPPPPPPPLVVPQPSLQAPAPTLREPVTRKPPEAKLAPVIEPPVQPATPPAEAVVAEPLPPPAALEEPIEPAATLPLRPPRS